MSFGRGVLLLLAINGAAGRGEDKFPDPMLDRGLEEVDTTDDVDLGIISRILNRLAHVHLSGEVEDRFEFAAFEHLVDHGTCDVQLKKFRFAGNIGPLAGGKGLKNGNPVLQGMERASKI